VATLGAIFGFSLALANRLRSDISGLGRSPMRVLAMLALALLLAGCQGERIKQGMQAQPQSTGLLA
jgi:hypothetical protein